MSRQSSDVDRQHSVVSHILPISNVLLSSVYARIGANFDSNTVESGLNFVGNEHVVKANREFVG